MKAVYCPYCGGRTKRNGRTSSGSQRWRCTACGASTTVRYDDTATRLEEFLGWLLSKDSQATMPGGGRSFRRRTAEFWEVWPMPVPDGELHRVLHVDGIWVARDLVVLICCSGERVVSWYMARSENSRAWSALMAPIPAPEVVVTDGGSGFAKAVRETWPRTRVQRCTFHAFSQ
ncbi:transposase, partial [Collinsella aerofaciens]